MFDSFSEGIVLTDSSMSLRWMNPMAEFLLGIQLNDWMGKPVQAMLAANPALTWIFDDKQPENLRCWQVMGCKDQTCPLWGKLFTDCWTEKKCRLCQTSLSTKGQEDQRLVFVEFIACRYKILQHLLGLLSCGNVMTLYFDWNFPSYFARYIKQEHQPNDANSHEPP